MPGTSSKNILVLRFSAMGDVAMTVPVLLALTQQHPDVVVTVASRSTFKPFFDDIPGVTFYTADFNTTHKGFFGLLKLFKALNKQHIYAVADLHNVLRSKIITKVFSVIGKKTGATDKLREQRKRLTAISNKVFEPMPPVTQRHADVFAKLGFPVDLSHPIFFKKQSIPEDISNSVGTKSGNWIGIAPFAQHSGKVYSADLMQQVINTLAKDIYNTLFLFGGSKAEAEQLNIFAGTRANVIVIAGGKMSLKQELQLISNLDLMLSMDSANAHMAAMYGVKVVTLWGATHPYAGFAPYAQPLENTLVSDREKFPMLPTSIYGNKVVDGYDDVMRTITPKMVVDKVYEVLVSN
jgi:ADP-heptose:LPS heptosyltransferase